MLPYALGGILESACLSVHLPVYLPNSSLCLSAGGGIKSHLLTALVFFTSLLHNKL